MAVTNVRVGPELRDKSLVVSGIKMRSSQLFSVYPSNQSDSKKSESVDHISKLLYFSMKITPFKIMSHYIHIFK